MDCFRTGGAQFESDVIPDIHGEVVSVPPTFTKWMYATLAIRIVLVIALTVMTVQSC